HLEVFRVAKRRVRLDERLANESGPGHDRFEGWGLATAGAERKIVAPRVLAMEGRLVRDQPIEAVLRARRVGRVTRAGVQLRVAPGHVPHPLRGAVGLVPE